MSQRLNEIAPTLEEVEADLAAIAELKGWNDALMDMVRKALIFGDADTVGEKIADAVALGLDGITVDYYGTPTPMNQLANLSAPDPRLLVVAAFDKGSLNDIEKANIVYAFSSSDFQGDAGDQEASPSGRAASGRKDD